MRPPKGTRVILKGLKAKPELNGLSGKVIKEYDPETGRCGILLDRDGSGVNAKPSNISIPSADEELEAALKRLKEVGGVEEEDESDEDAKDISEYLDELIAVGDARYNAGHYDLAGGIFYRSYFGKMHQSQHINSPGVFPIAHKMLQAWSKSEQEHNLRMAHGMAESTCMMPGCPPYIRQDMNEIARAMKKRGMKVDSIMNAFNGLHF